MTVSRSAEEKFVLGLGQLLGECRDGLCVSNMERYSPVPKRANRTSKDVWSALPCSADEESRRILRLLSGGDPSVISQVALDKSITLKWILGAVDISGIRLASRT